MTQTFFLGQLRLALVAIIAYAGGRGWLTPTDAGLATAMLTSLGPLIGPWAWSIYANINSKLVPAHTVVVDPVITAANAGAELASIKTATGTIVGKVVVSLLIGLFVLSFLAGSHPAMAQAKLRSPQFTGDVVADTKANLGINRPGSGLTGNPLGDIVGALDVKLLPDLQYALKLATASGSRVTGPCYQAWIDIINVRQKAVQDDQTPPQAMAMPDPHLVTDFEKLVELRNSLQPDSEFMIRCSPVASMVKKDIIGFIGIVISGGAGLATLVPGL